MQISLKIQIFKIFLLDFNACSDNKATQRVEDDVQKSDSVASVSTTS
jgi:hypothetical protein